MLDDKVVRTSLAEDLGKLGVKESPEHLNFMGTHRLDEALATTSKLGAGKSPVISTQEYGSLDEEVRDFFDEVLSIDFDHADDGHLDRISDLMETIDYDALSEDVQGYYNDVAEYISEQYVELQEKIRKTVNISSKSGKGGAKRGRQQMQAPGKAHVDTMKKKHSAGYAAKKHKASVKRNKAPAKRILKNKRQTKSRMSSSLAHELSNIMSESANKDVGIQDEIKEQIERIFGILNWFMEDVAVESVIEEALDTLDTNLVEGTTDEDFGSLIVPSIEMISRLCEEIEQAEKN